MTQPRSLVIGVALLFIMVGLAAASTTGIYIAQNAVGANTGADCADAHSATWFNSSSNWGAGAGQIGAGITAHLCGSFTSQLTAKGSGVSGSPVIIFFEPGAMISLPACDATNGCLSIAGLSNITVDGGSNGVIQDTKNGTGQSQTASRGIMANNCNNCEIRNLTIRNIYVRTSSSDTSFDQTAMVCIAFSGSNWLIHDNVMHDAGWCLENFWNSGDSGVKIYNNEIYNIDHGWALAGVSGSASSFAFYNNHVHDFAVWDSGSNSFHHDGIHAFGVNGAKQTDIWIYNNTFDGDIGANATGYIFMEGGSGQGTTPWTDGSGVAHIYNNLFLGGNRLVYGLLQVHKGNGVEIYNNYVTGSSSSTCTTVDQVTNLYLKNNVFSACNTLIYLLNSTTLAQYDYNLYASSGSNAFVSGTKFIPFSSFSTWQSVCVCDVHGVAVADAKMDSNGHPMPSSPVIGAANNLTGLGQISLDADRSGNPRAGMPTAWDIGAYNANAGPLPPGNLDATVK